jgi:hypothetical protein
MKTAISMPIRIDTPAVINYLVLGVANRKYSKGCFRRSMSYQNWRQKINWGSENEIEIENGDAVFNCGEFYCDISLWW